MEEINMSIQIKESKRFIIGFSKKGGLCFFVHHKDISPANDPIPISPVDLTSYLGDAIKFLKNPEKHAEKFAKRWPVEKYPKVKKYLK